MHLSHRRFIVALAICAVTACIDASGPAPSAERVAPDDAEFVSGPPGTNGEWWLRGDLVQDSIAPR